MKHVLLLFAAIAMLAGLTGATVTSKAVTVSPMRGLPQHIQLNLSSSQAVAGIQGQINFDSSIFSNPQVAAGPGASAFTVMGNLVATGQYRFIAYANPTKSIALGTTAIEFRFDTASVLPVTGSRTITYTLEAASSTNGQSLTSDFSNVSVLFRRNSASNWTLYE